MAEEQQVMKEPQQVTIKEPQQVTIKNPKKVEAGKHLAVHNHRQRDLKVQKTTDCEAGLCQWGELNQYYGIGVVLAVGVIGGLGYYIYQSKKEEASPSGALPSGEQPSNLQQNNSPKP